MIKDLSHSKALLH